MTETNWWLVASMLIVTLAQIILVKAMHRHEEDEKAHRQRMKKYWDYWKDKNAD